MDVFAFEGIVAFTPNPTQPSIVTPKATIRQSHAFYQFFRPLPPA